MFLRNIKTVFGRDPKKSNKTNNVIDTNLYQSVKNKSFSFNWMIHLRMKFDKLKLNALIICRSR